MAKDRVHELAGKIREAAALHDPVARAIIELVKLSSDDLKESLVSAEGNDMLRLQGAARHLTKLHKEMTVTPPNIAAQKLQEQ
jgi:N-acetylglucosamine kinase-like BadF-type ATPase